MRPSYEFLGRALYWVLFPFLLVVFWRSRRVYAVIYCDNEILLIKNWLGSGKWSFPGGGMKTGESAKSALIREVSEEIGVSLNQADLHSIFGWRRHRNGFYYRYFSVNITKKPVLMLQKSEITHAEWVSVSEARARLKLPELNALDK